MTGILFNDGEISVPLADIATLDTAQNSDRFATAQVSSDSIDSLNRETLTKLIKFLQPSATLRLNLPSEFTNSKFSVLRKNLIFSGFTISQRTPEFILASKPASTSAVSIGSASAKKNIIDESSLLSQDEGYVSLSDPTDCMTKPKPCKNCTCGRAEEEARKEAPQVKSSSCGRCYMGDAYRCDGCPYRGLPAFNPGEAPKSELGSAIQIETSAKVEGGRVTLDL